ncbi:transcription factor A, mitochondrial [Antechinus flavipes]|uniref:transcription factor A, mitochondrial n=1 Tax=Antechinus flavipes TaxID=38775 RepID=UPI0022359E38|nr:transcription factor A, mitochondrial [Antechinus flavipes]
MAAKAATQLLHGSWGALRALGRPAALRVSAVSRGLLEPPLSNSFCGLEWFMKDCTLSNAPKKPLSAYIRFTVEHRPIIKEQNPDLKNTEIIKKLAEAWRELPQSKKKVYEEATKAEFKIYKEETSKYKAELDPAEKKNLKEEKRRRRVRKEIIKKKRELTIFGKPKKPRSGYNIFISEHFKEGKGISSQETMKLLNEEWKNLSPSRKQIYIQLAEDDKIRYANEIKSWEEKMIEIGREDLLRFRKLSTKMGKHLEDIY